ncbi:hypothetical protein C2S53_016206 [Perilla frutescens var. hirtella]|uniref:Ubiquitin-like protease family profile domain-containing protein n=1 Tax=Perilla frutescens var. hirtella TaxID=608512 RepID=A0AAD4IYW3_PERFH|nr:hypothetical protein C2S53_016206 [Perilla frutescens var. hirtella]
MKARSEIWLQQEHNKSFISWLRVRLEQTSSERLKWMANGPNKTVLTYQSYLVKGVTYHTKERDRLRTTQNSGAKGIKEVVEFNSKQQPYGPVASEIQSYIGVLARKEVKICYNSWKDVPKEVKEKIWDHVKMSYQVEDNWKIKCFESACTKWRQWKSGLYKKHILPNKDNPDKLNDPPSGSGIRQEDWRQYVISRMSDDFKKLSSLQSERCKMNQFPHRLSRRGYAGLGEQLKDELHGDDEIDRAIMWKKARVVKSGDIEDEKLKNTFEKIDDYIQQKKEGKFKSKGWGEDVLTRALEKPEHSGRVRGLGSYITPTVYFKQFGEKEKGLKPDEKTELMEARKHIAKQDLLLMQLQERLTRLEEQKEADDEKGSCSVKQPVHPVHLIDENIEDVELISEMEASLGKSVSLLSHSSKAIVAYGTVVTPSGDSFPDGCLCVAIDEVLDPDMLLPYPISDNSQNLGDAVGSHIAWPAFLVTVKEMSQKKKMKEIKEVKKRMVNNYDSLKSSLKVLYLYGERNLKNGEGILISFDDDVFGCEFEIHLHIEDIVSFCELEPISGNCIAAYICYLYKILVEKDRIDTCRFMDPFSVSYVPKQSQDDRARALFQGIEKVSTTQLAIVPCNVGLHWILTVIDPHKESIYLFDPLCHRIRNDTWTQTVNKAIFMYNAKIGRRGKKQPHWEIVKGPIQPDSKQCGFFVMRYMKEIIDEIAIKGSISLKSHVQMGDMSTVQV